MIIGVDAVGGDHYPSNPIQGGLMALQKDPQLHVLFFGPEEMVQSELEKQKPSYEGVSERVHVQHAPQIVDMEDSPSQAIKTKTASSIAIGLGAHKKGHCHAFVSAGNTGALLAASTLILGKLEGVLRPTIGSVYPTLKGFRLLLDVGASLELRPEHYVQFAKMGTIYARELMKIDSPTVGLLNVGEEEEKGTDLLREAYKLLSQHANFVGNIEGRDIFPAKADVFVCDGYVGNLLLKFGESIPEALTGLIGRAMKEKNLAPETQATIAGVLRGAFNMFNYENVGGVPFLGVNGVSMVGHGGSTPLAIQNMILNAAECVRQDLNAKIVSSLTHT